MEDFYASSKTAKHHRSAGIGQHPRCLRFPSDYDNAIDD
jgi:hypothetical protein